MSTHLHPREQLVREAVSALKSMLIKWCQKHGKELTFAEEVSIVSRVMGDWLRISAKYAIRKERHGDTNKPGELL